VEVYAMAVEQQRDQWPEDFRGREWLPVAEAARRVEEPALRQMIESLQFALAAQGS
jgi:hypothetical protein